MRPDLTRIVDAFQNDLVQFTRKLIQTRSLPGEEQAVGALVQAVRTDCAILGQASRNELRNGHRGRLEVLVHYIGRSVHASVPARGANPHYAMARFLTRLHELRMVSDAVLGHSTVSPTIVK